MQWTHPQCNTCWEKENPGRTPHRLSLTLSVGEETCCTCGVSTKSGIYIRRDPKTVPYPAPED